MRLNSRSAYLALAGWILAAGLLSACGGPSQPQIPETPDEITVAIFPYLSYAPFFIAEEEGFFQEQGLKADFVKFGRTSEAIPALAAGDLDVASGLITVGTLNAIAQGGQIAYVADKGYANPDGCSYTTFMASKDLLDSGGLASPKDLAGKRVALSTASSAEYYLDVLLEEGGLTRDQVDLVDIPLPTRLEGMTSGELDLAAVSEPWATRIAATGSAEVWMPLEEVLPGFQLSVVMYGPSFLNDDTGLGVRFMRAYLKAVRQYEQGKTDRNVEILEKYTGLDADLLRQSCWQSFRADGSIDTQSVLDFQSWAEEDGLLIRDLVPEEFWDASYIEDALAWLASGG